MLSSFSIIWADPINIDIDGQEQIQLDVFNPTSGFGNNGILSIIAFVAQFAFAFLIVIWIFISIFAGIKFIRSQGDPEGIEGGKKRIQNLWMAVSIGILFFVVASFMGYFAGIGNIFQWADNLKECECDSSLSGRECYSYLFQAKAKNDDKKTRWVCWHDGQGWIQAHPAP